MVLHEESYVYVTICTQRGLCKKNLFTFWSILSSHGLSEGHGYYSLRLPQSYLLHGYFSSRLNPKRTSEEPCRGIRLFKLGLRFKQEKCNFMQDSVEYLVDAEGVHAAAGNVEAIVKTPALKISLNYTHSYLLWEVSPKCGR